VDNTAYSEASAWWTNDGSLLNIPSLHRFLRLLTSELLGTNLTAL
jgi:hypothetical protein